MQPAAVRGRRRHVSSATSATSPGSAFAECSAKCSSLPASRRLTHYSVRQQPPCRPPTPLHKHMISINFQYTPPPPPPPPNPPLTKHVTADMYSLPGEGKKKQQQQPSFVSGGRGLGELLNEPLAALRLSLLRGLAEAPRGGTCFGEGVVVVVVGVAWFLLLNDIQNKQEEHENN